MMKWCEEHPHGRRDGFMPWVVALHSSALILHIYSLQSAPFSETHSLGGTALQTQPDQPDGQRDGVPADGVRRGGETASPPLLVQRQPASPPNVRCRRTPTPSGQAFRCTAAHNQPSISPQLKRHNFLLLHTLT